MDGAARRLQQAWLSRGALACLLWPLSLLYRLLQALARRRHAAATLDVPVIVVGNLIVGGAGKTPTVLALLALLQQQGWRPGVVSRGYGRDTDDLLEVGEHTDPRRCGDEPLLLHRRGRVPVVVGRDRVAAARLLRERHPAVDVIVSDDGLQHRRLPRDAQLIVFDERGIGNGWLLPAGPLREPFDPAPPPRSVVVYNAAAPSTPWPGWVVRRALGGVLPLAHWWAGSRAWLPLDTLRGRRLVAVAGIARPQRFFGMLHTAGLAIDERPLPDHHDFAELPWPAGTPEVVLTEKDAVKLRPERCATTRVWVAALDFALDPAAAAALLALLPRRP
ncbi:MULTISPECIES: tetraacyldisaccharide 4'-kinase [Piscinibacter]|uniref:tetraacyldisaccharide 4'-kinase n=1 Tax=Piscinibacter TaxID=1114981 RepID=UPI001F0BF4E8|nr:MULTISPECIES: tetraacyldisaccharide 4'-kinase [Piscinibacter]